MSMIDRLFERMLAMYGDRFAKMWGGVDPASMKDVWGRELADLTNEEWRRGVAALSDMDWPPSLPEFKKACRVQLDYEAAFNEAANRFGGKDFSDPSIYWAALAVGAEVRTQPYQRMKSRWVAALDDARRNPRGPIPKATVTVLADKGAKPVEDVAVIRERVLAQYRK